MAGRPAAVDANGGVVTIIAFLIAGLALLVLLYQIGVPGFSGDNRDGVSTVQVPAEPMALE